MERDILRSAILGVVMLLQAMLHFLLKKFIPSLSADYIIHILKKSTLNKGAVVVCNLQQSVNQNEDSSLWTEKHEKNMCAMYGLCAERADGKPLNCPYPTPAVTPSEAFSNKIQTLCPTISGDVCCTNDQFNVLRKQVQQAIPYLTGCPACLRNYLNLFCEFACSSDQSLFINVTSIQKVVEVESVKSVDFFVTEKYGARLYDSCKDVKYTATNSRAMEFVGGGATNYSDWFGFMGREAKLNEPGSPFAIQFRTSVNSGSPVQPLDPTVTACSDSTLSCSCDDCPSASQCSSPSAPAHHNISRCSVYLGTLEVGCLPVGMLTMYTVVAFAIFGWWWTFHSPRDLNEQEESSMLSPVSESSLNDEYLEIQPAERYVDAEKILEAPDYTKAFLADYFRSEGERVARHAYSIITVALVVMLVLFLGLLQFSVETRPEKLWVNPGSKAAQEKNFFDNHLAPFYRKQQFILATTPAEGQTVGPSIVTDENLLLMFNIQKKVDEMQGNVSGDLVSLHDICVKSLGTPCATQSILQYFKMDQDIFKEYSGASHADFCFKHYSSSASCLSAFEGHVAPSTVLGGFAEKNYTQATAFVVTYPVVNSVEDSGEGNAAAVAWEYEFIRVMQEEVVGMVGAYNLTIAFSSDSSIESELERESTWDLPTIAISYIVMFVYISFSLSSYAPSVAPFYVTSKVTLALSGVLIVALSVLGSMGIFSAFGVKSTLIIFEVIPFLVLALGVDNMYIMVNALKRQDPNAPLETRVGLAMAEVGPSITLTSLAEVLAFSVGILSPTPACRVFSMFAALAVLLDYLLQITAFVALLTLDAKRTEKLRVDCLPCLSVVRSDSERSQPDSPGRLYQDPGLLVRYMQNVHAPLIANPGVQAVVLALFTAMLFTSIALLPSLSIGLDEKVVLPRDSYLQGYFDNVTKHIRVGPPVYFVVKDYNYSIGSNQTDLLCSVGGCDSNSLLNEVTIAALTPDTSFIERPATSWLDDFLVWLSPNAFECCREFPDGSYCPPDDQPPCCPAGQGLCGLNATCSECTTCVFQRDLLEGRPSTSQFHDKLLWFLKATPSADCAKGGSGAYSNSLDLTGYDSGVIKASEFRAYHTPLNEQSDYINALQAVKDFTSQLSKKLNIEVFAYSVFYIFFEQYLDLVKTTAISLCLALAAVFVVCLITSSSIWASAMNVTVISMIIIDLMGLMVLCDIQLNSVSVVNLVMAIGIAVEFCAHITHVFTMRTGRRGERATKALIDTGVSVFSGITLTKFVGILVLFFSRTKIFEIYYFRMYSGLAVLGALHGLIFLPVLLSLAGPRSLALFSYTVDGKEVYYKNQDHDHHFNGFGVVKAEPTSSDPPGRN